MHQDGRLECNEICTGTDPDNQARSGEACVSVNAFASTKKQMSGIKLHVLLFLQTFAHPLQAEEQTLSVSVSISVSASV